VKGLVWKKRRKKEKKRKKKEKKSIRTGPRSISSRNKQQIKNYYAVTEKRGGFELVYKLNYH